MKRIILTILLVVSVLSACKREPIYNLKSDYQIRVKIDTTGTFGTYSAGIMAIQLYDVETDKSVYNTFSSNIEHLDDGIYMTSYLTGLTQGAYKMLVYNFDTKMTKIEDIDRWSRAYARTNLIDYSNGTPMVYAPDPLLIASDSYLEVPAVYNDEGVHVIETVAKSMMKTYRIEVRGVHNLPIATSISLYLSGQISSAMMCDGEQIQDKVILAMSGTPEYRKAGEVKDSLIVSTFSTFGKLKNAEHCYLTLVIGAPNGATYYSQTDVVDYLSDDNLSRIVPVRVDISVEPRKDGGMDPSTDEWNDEEHKIDIK